MPLPEYQLMTTSGPDHALQFTVSARVSGFEETTATASSKRAAETAAAAALLERLMVNLNTASYGKAPKSPR